MVFFYSAWRKGINATGLHEINEKIRLGQNLGGLHLQPTGSLLPWYNVIASASRIN
jgi:hypothetical protein